MNARLNKIYHLIFSRRTLFILPLVALLFFTSSKVLAEDNLYLPDPIVGQTTVITPDGNKFFGGLGGNDSITNYYSDFTFGYNQSAILKCSGLSNIESLPACFILDAPTGSLGLARSRTYNDGISDLEVPVVFYPKNTVIGDIFGQNSALPNFTRFGRHLSLASPGVGDFWNLPNYQFNLAAQAYWNSGNNQTMNETVARLLQNAKALSNSSTNSLTGQFDGICYPAAANSCSEANQYSDGRVWYSRGSLTITGGISYSKKATIIVESGNLSIDGSVLSLDQNASIGFIVKNGNVTIRNTVGSKKINGLFFVPNGSIRLIGNNINLTGSFVAGNFSASGSNLSFVQDTRGETAWPPGFRDLLPLTRASN